MKCIAFALRNLKELIRDPVMMFFCIGFPVIILLLLSAIQANIPIELFAIQNLAPGIAVFGLSFLTLFAGFLISKDRATSFLMRLFTTPLTAAEFLWGYIIPLLPIGILQCVGLFILAIVLGLEITLNIVLTIVVLLPTVFLFISFGLFFGSLVNDKAIGGVSSILINLAAWLSGAWFDVKIVGKTFSDISYALPFAHAVDAARAALSGKYADIFPHLWWVIGYTVIILVAAIYLFHRKMNV